MRYALQTVVGVALIWALVACQSGPSQQFIEKVKGEFAQLENVPEQAKSHIDKLATLKKSLEDLKTELGKNWEKVEKDKELSAQYQTLAQQIADLDNQVNTAQGEAQSAVSDARNFVDGLAQQTKKDEELDKDWGQIREKVNGASSKLTEFGSKISDLEGEVSKFVETVKGKFTQAKK